VVDPVGRGQRANFPERGARGAAAQQESYDRRPCHRQGEAEREQDRERSGDVERPVVEEYLACAIAAVPRFWHQIASGSGSRTPRSHKYGTPARWKALARTGGASRKGGCSRNVFRSTWTRTGCGSHSLRTPWTMSMECVSRS